MRLIYPVTGEGAEEVAYFHLSFISVVWIGGRRWHSYHEKLFPTYSTENTFVPCGHLCLCGGCQACEGSHHIRRDDRMVRVYFLLSKWERASHDVVFPNSHDVQEDSPESKDGRFQ